MAPPKRKTGGGRVTPKGTRPGDRAASPSSSPDSEITSSRSTVAASARYTPKQSRRQLIPPNWIPVIMLVLLIGGGLVIMARYLVWDSSNLPTIIGLAMIMGGLFAATKWE